MIVVPVICSVHGCPPKKQEVRGQGYCKVPLKNAQLRFSLHIRSPLPTGLGLSSGAETRYVSEWHPTFLPAVVTLNFLQSEYNNFYDGAPLRLVVSFLIDDVDVMKLVPPLLRPYTSAIKMVMSNLQIFEAENEGILVKVLEEIKKHKGRNRQPI